MTGDELKKHIALNLKNARKAKAWTMQKTADKLGCCLQELQMWENGRRTPRPQTLCDIAELYGVDVFDLLKK